MRSIPILLLAAGLLLAACRNPDVREDPYVESPDTLAVEGPLYDPDEVDPGDRPASEHSAEEAEARRTLLGDVNTLEAQVIVVGDVVRITAVLDEQGAEAAERKAEQFVAAAARHIERRAGTDAGAEDILGPTNLTYEVLLNDRDGNEVFAGTKAPGASEIAPAPAGAPVPTP
jgi:hypothetical protein